MGLALDLGTWELKQNPGMDRWPYHNMSGQESVQSWCPRHAKREQAWQETQRRKRGYRVDYRQPLVAKGNFQRNGCQVHTRATLFCHGKLASYLTPCLNRSAMPQEPETRLILSTLSGPLCLSSLLNHGKLCTNFASVLFANEKGSDPTGFPKPEKGPCRLTASLKNSLAESLYYFITHNPIMRNFFLKCEMFP